MIVHISINIVNSKFSQDYADQYEFGEESVNNMKYNYSIAIEIDKVSFNEDTRILYELKKGIKFLFEKVTVLCCYQKEKLVAAYSFSTELLIKTHEIFKKEQNKKYCYFYLRDDVEFKEIGNHNYLIKEDVTRIA
ncbi:hypothetical protein [Wenyingzhuangia sp. IMCC45574]